MFNLFKKKTKESTGYLTVTVIEYKNGHPYTAKYIYNRVTRKFEEFKSLCVEQCHLFDSLFECKAYIINQREYKKFLARANSQGNIIFTEVIIEETKKSLKPVFKTTRFYYVPSRMMLELWDWGKTDEKGKNNSSIS